MSAAPALSNCAKTTSRLDADACLLLVLSVGALVILAGCAFGLSLVAATGFRKSSAGKDLAKALTWAVAGLVLLGALVPTFLSGFELERVECIARGGVDVVSSVCIDVDGRVIP